MNASPANTPVAAMMAAATRNILFFIRGYYSIFLPSVRPVDLSLYGNNSNN